MFGRVRTTIETGWGSENHEVLEQSKTSLVQQAEKRPMLPHTPPHKGWLVENALHIKSADEQKCIKFWIDKYSRTINTTEQTSAQTRSESKNPI